MPTPLPIVCLIRRQHKKAGIDQSENSKYSYAGPRSSDIIAFPSQNHGDELAACPVKVKENQGDFLGYSLCNCPFLFKIEVISPLLTSLKNINTMAGQTKKL